MRGSSKGDGTLRRPRCTSEDPVEAPEPLHQPVEAPRGSFIRQLYLQVFFWPLPQVFLPAFLVAVFAMVSPPSLQKVSHRTTSFRGRRPVREGSSAG